MEQQQTAKEELMAVRRMGTALHTLDKEIAQCRADMYALQATDYSTDRVSGGQSKDLSDKIAKLMELKEQADQQWDTLILTRTVVRKKIDRVADPLLRSILVEYYILSNTWEEVAEHFNCSWRNTMRLHRKALRCYEMMNL